MKRFWYSQKQTKQQSNQKTKTNHTNNHTSEIKNLQGEGQKIKFEPLVPNS